MAGLPLGVRLRLRTLLALPIAIEEEELRVVLFPPGEPTEGTPSALVEQ